MIRDIVYALSHDLRTPLAAAGLTLRQARDGAYGAMPPRYLEILDRSIAANDELQRLAETLLLVAQYESGERSAVHRPVDLDRLVRDVVAQMRSLADSKHLRIEIATAEAVVLGDPGELRRALVNLFANAVTWSREGGGVEIGMQVEGRAVRVFVADHGFGVPDDFEISSCASPGTMREVAAQVSVSTSCAASPKRTVDVCGYEPNEPQGSIFSIELPMVEAPVPADVSA